MAGSQVFCPPPTNSKAAAAGGSVAPPAAAVATPLASKGWALKSNHLGDAPKNKVQTFFGKSIYFFEKSKLFLKSQNFFWTVQTLFEMYHSNGLPKSS